MLFNSFEFIFLFLPTVVVLYFFFNRLRLIRLGDLWLAISSLVFYSWWNLSYLPLILLSIIVNYYIGQVIQKGSLNKKVMLFLGVTFNIGLLGYYKYVDFFIYNVNSLFATNFSLLEIALPLAISFFTFQQIANIVDIYKGEIKSSNLLDYILFVTFFPQLIAGPIVHHKEIIPQFSNLRKKVVNPKNVAIGIFFFSVGLFKKVILADTYAVWATQGFDQLEVVTFIEGWVISLSYTFQIYFDFSGYMDMAIGAALLLNIRLPFNFNSPYKATNIQDVWNKWHMTLGRFLYRYVYTPLNKFLLRKVFIPLNLKHKVNTRTSLSLFLMFIVSGIWHGAGWTFIFWGFLHGVATVVHRYWKQTKIKMNKVLAWFITFNFINFTMVFFRAESFSDAVKVLKGMIGMNGIVLPIKYQTIIPSSLKELFIFSNPTLLNISEAIQYIVIGFIIILVFKNTRQLAEKFKPTIWTFLFTILLLLYSILNLTKVSEFIYFNF
ncbi:MBOAT family protein [Bacillus sp. BGMRC 2118]|nr:MBOAT family protein [Bacillus sp. BGMRC 2118]